MATVDTINPASNNPVIITSPPSKILISMDPVPTSPITTDPVSKDPSNKSPVSRDSSNRSPVYADLSIKSAASVDCAYKSLVTEEPSRPEIPVCKESESAILPPVTKKSSPKTPAPRSPGPRSPAIIRPVYMDPLPTGPAYMGQVNVAILGHHPVLMVCPFCKYRIITKIKSSPSAVTWLMCGAIFCLSWFCGCCLIPCWLLPFCVTELQDVDHYCPNCGKLIGRNY